ncbi:MerR family transcriptional regulator [Streptomyces sp. NPDC006237]|uniref:MerR family transcriptional regulator n=2 Tax=unclassified Streptomyces TaxID=2593676 RepID=UPI0033A22CB1
MPGSLRLSVGMKSSGPQLTIGALADRFGLESHVLRYWESMGLLTPGRDHAGRRRYAQQDVLRVAVILCGKEAGLPLVSIAAMLTTTDPAERQEILLGHRDALRHQIAQTQAALDLVECAVECAHADLATCPSFRQHLVERARL